MTPYRDGLLTLIVGLVLAFLILYASAAHAQLVSPTTNYTLAWDYTGPAVHHFEVRYGTSAAWSSVGTALQTPVPTLPTGSYTVYVRACATATPTTATCPLAALLFTVALTPPATAPTSVKVK